MQKYHKTSPTAEFLGSPQLAGPCSTPNKASPMLNEVEEYLSDLKVTLLLIQSNMLLEPVSNGLNILLDLNMGCLGLESRLKPTVRQLGFMGRPRRPTIDSSH